MATTFGKLLTLAIMFFSFYSCSKTEEQEYDQLQLKGKWEQIIEKDQQHPTQILACQKVVKLARFRMGLTDNNAIHECLSDSRDVLTNPTTAIMMSDLYMQLGMINMAQRAAFEALVKEPESKNKGRILRRLTETAIVTKQYDLALKYIALLEKDSTHRKWARNMREIAKHPEQIVNAPIYEKMQQSYEETEDQFFL